MLPAKVNCLEPQNPQTIVLHLKAAMATVPLSPGLHWVVDPLPTGADLQVSDPALQSGIETWVRNQNALDPGKKHPWVLDGRNSWTFFNSGLGPGIADFTINPYPLVPPPSEKQTSVGRVTFCAARRAENFHLDMLMIQVVSAGFDPHKPHAPQKLDAKLDENVTASALLSDEESRAAPGAILHAFSQVAEIAWQKAKQNGIAIGSDTTDQALRQAETSITAVYNMAQNDIPFQFWGQWPEPRAIFQHSSDGNCCILTVQNVQMAKSAVIQVEAHLPDSTPASEEGKISQKPNGIVAHAAQITKHLKARNAQQRADKLADSAEKTLSKRFEGILAGLKNTVPTFAQVDSLRSSLSAAREIYPTVRLGIRDGESQVIVFDADYRWTILKVNLSAGGGYSAEDRGTGTLDLQGENLIVPIPDALNPKEAENLHYSGGGEVQKANAGWSITWNQPHASGAQSSYGPQISGDYLQDHNQRFGNLTGPLLRDHEIGWQPSFTYGFSSSQVNHLGNPSANVYGVSVDAGFRQRWVGISPAIGNLFPPQARGELTAFVLDVTPGYHYAPPKPVHIGGVDLSGAAHFLRGFPAGDFTFTQLLVSAQATLFFGISHPRDFFVRFRKGMGTSNGETPLFELFRLGGNDNTRGVEQGEQIGREIAFEQYEGGISARQLISWIRGESKASQPEQTPKATPIDLTKIYLKGFYDRGRVSETGSFADLLAFHHGAKGYGAAVEMEVLSAGNKRVTLSMGYARSPDSVLHRKGVPITSASVDF
jgi:hypothetical protein